MKRNFLLVLLVVLGFVLGLLFILSSQKLAGFYFSQMGTYSD